MPSFHTNLLSIRQFWRKNRIKTRFGERDFFKLLTGQRLYFDDSSGEEHEISCFKTTLGIPDTILHRRLGHVGIRRLRQASSRSTGLDGLQEYNMHLPCDDCEAAGKQRWRPKQYKYSKTPESRIKRTTKAFGEKVSSDLCGPFAPSIVRNYRYAICFIDDYTSYARTYYLKSISPEEVLHSLQRFEKEYKAFLPNGHVQTWHTDNEGPILSCTGTVVRL